MPKGTPTPISKPTPPTWIYKLSWRNFPYGPRSLYFYLCAFSSRECFLYNCMLALHFDVSISTIKRWIRWLRRHALISLSLRSDPSRPLDTHSFKTIRRIFVRHYPTPESYVTALAKHYLKMTARKHRISPTQTNAWSDLSPAQQTARKDKLIRQLFALKP
jgi:hypothetical protein